MNVARIFRGASVFLVKNSQVILTGFSIAGVIGTAIFAGEAKVKAQAIIDNMHDDYVDDYLNGDNATDSPPKSEVFKKVLPVYIPTIIMGGLTIGCIIGSTYIGSKQNAVLAGLYSASEMALKEYQDKVVQTIGEKKEHAIRDEITRDRLVQNPVSNNQIIITGMGEALCYDVQSGRYFKSDIEKIRSIQNNINRDIITDMWVDLNQLYYEFGLSAVKLGDEVGWDIDHRLEFDFSSHITDNNLPCLVIDYKVHPKYH